MTGNITKGHLLHVNKEIVGVNLKNIVQDVKSSCYANLTQFHEDILIDGGFRIENSIAQQQRVRNPHASNNKMIVTKPEHKKPNERHKI